MIKHKATLLTLALTLSSSTMGMTGAIDEQCQFALSALRTPDPAGFKLSSRLLTIKTGEVLAILGPSGQGKTTLIRLVTGYESPVSGCGGKITDIYHPTGPVSRREWVRRRFKLIEGPDATPTFWPRHALNPIGYTDSGDTCTLLECLEAVKNRPDSLSHAKQPRVNLARSLILEPDILLLDEPTDAGIVGAPIVDDKPAKDQSSDQLAKNAETAKVAAKAVVAPQVGPTDGNLPVQEVPRETFDESSGGDALDVLAGEMGQRFQVNLKREVFQMNHGRISAVYLSPEKLDLNADAIRQLLNQHGGELGQVLVLPNFTTASMTGFKVGDLSGKLELIIQDNSMIMNLSPDR